jgi:hypothetical protein
MPTMHYRHTLFLIATLYAATFVVLKPSVAQTPEHKTVWSGVYTDAQADRGSSAYQENCSPCHGADLEGVANLKGTDFMERWREFDLRGLYDWISKSMPRMRRGSPNRPGSLSEATYVDIIAHIFRANGFPAGDQELATSVMKNVQIEYKDGPRPVPNGALVQMVGCLTKRGNGWALTHSTEPMRTASTGASTEEEMKDAKAKTLAYLDLALTNFGYIPDFDPAAHVNEKMQTKGFLTRQPGNNRINVTSLETLASTCP